MGVIVETKNQVVIIGGGISGLTSAYELAESGFKVTVLEKENWIGGRLYPFAKDGFLADVGAQLIGQGYYNVFKLLNKLDLNRFIKKIKEPSAAIYSDQKIFLFNIMGLIKYPKLNSKEKIDLLRLARKIKNLGKKYKFSFVNSDYIKEFDSLSIAEWTLENFNENLFEFFVQPSLTALTLTEPENLSTHYGLTLLFSDFDNSYTLKNGTSFLISNLIQQLYSKKVEIKTNCKVNRVVVKNSSVSSVEYEANGTAINLETSNIICSTPAPLTEQILPFLSTDLKSKLLKIEYSKGIQVLIALDRRIWDKSWAILVPRTEFKDISMISEATVKCKSFAPGGKGLMEVYIYGPTSIKLSKRSNEEISSFAIDILENLFPKIGERVLWCEVFRWEQIIPIHQPGVTISQQQIVTPKGLFLSGDYFYQPSLESAVYSGFRASEALIKEKVG
jgi:protoporphyrinogen oxidase